MSVRYSISAEDFLRLLVLAGESGSAVEAAYILHRSPRIPDTPAESGDVKTDPIPPAKPE